MIKAIEKWLIERDNAARQEQFDTGFGYGAMMMLRHGKDMSDLDPEFDTSAFDSGIREADKVVSELQYKAKKLDRVEAENNDLREIVKAMQNELSGLLVKLGDVSKPQALSNAPASEHKLPFSEGHVPEWANWAAQDKCGFWYVYQNKPEISNDEKHWVVEGGTNQSEFMYAGNPNTEWETTLTRLKPEPEDKPIPEIPFDLATLPEWVNWVAQDANGTWYGYEKKPYLDLDGDQWIENSRDGALLDVHKSDVTGDWRKSLYQVSKHDFEYQADAGMFDSQLD